MSCLGAFRTLSSNRAHLRVRPGAGGGPTERWQDKSRKVRPGRLVRERRQSTHFAHLANKQGKLSFRVSAWKTETTCALRASVS
jgi:hypothetical protein